MNVPYNNGKIEIGKYYQKPGYVEQDHDMLHLQNYLIMSPRRLNLKYWFWKLYGFSVFLGAVVFLLPSK